MDTFQFNYYFIFLQHWSFLTIPFFFKILFCHNLQGFPRDWLFFLSFLVSLRQPLKNWSLPRFYSQSFTYLIPHTLPWVISSMHKLQLMLQMMTFNLEAHISTCICHKLMTSNWPQLTSSLSLSPAHHKQWGEKSFCKPKLSSLLIRLHLSTTILILAMNY